MAKEILRVEPCMLVVFGGTGDLTHRKLVPAVYQLEADGYLPDQFVIVSVGRREKSTAEYRNEVKSAVEQHARRKFRPEVWEKISERIFYYKLNFEEPGDYHAFGDFMGSLDAQYQTNDNRSYFLAVAPEFFVTITNNLSDAGLASSDNGWRRLMVEKPFGKDLETARKLNQEITQVFSEKDIYRIDHYLGKEMIQNIMVLRFANSIFEPIWNAQHIDNIQISSSEIVGVEGRGGYYEHAGAMRDMIQNHMLQILAMTAMEPPVSLETEAVRDEKRKVIRALAHYSDQLTEKEIVVAQYSAGAIGKQRVPAYRDEARVDPESETETFVALKLNIPNFRWGGMPFYLRTGKRLKDKATEIVIQFKTLPNVLYARQHENVGPNLLVIRIAPDEGVYMQFNAKKPGTEDQIMRVKMDFCQSCMIGENSPEAYERLIYDCLRGDSTLFTRWDEVEDSWIFADHIMSEIERKKQNIAFYPAGSWGPQESDHLLHTDGRHWWNGGAFD